MALSKRGWVEGPGIDLSKYSSTSEESSRYLGKKVVSEHSG